MFNYFSFLNDILLFRAKIHENYKTANIFPFFFRDLLGFQNPVGLNFLIHQYLPGFENPAGLKCTLEVCGFVFR